MKKKTTMEHEGGVYTSYNWCTWYNHQRINKGTGGLGNKRTSGYYPNCNSIKISYNTEKSPGDLSRFAVTQNSLKDYPLTLVLKSLRELIIIIIMIRVENSRWKGTHQH